MDINELIKKEAPGNNDHDNSYRFELLNAYKLYRTFTLKELLNSQNVSRRLYDSTHRMTAKLMVLYELIKEKKL